MLQATFTDAERAARFWDAAAGLMEQLANAPGFIRRYSFADGPFMTLLALWRTKADAEAFFASPEHQQAMRDLYAGRWQYTHFAQLWEMGTPRERVIFCQECDGVTPATAGTCSGCGVELVDPFVLRAVPA
jgi:heme-degrading monooxygenase HmoA